MGEDDLWCIDRGCQVGVTDAVAKPMAFSSKNMSGTFGTAPPVLQAIECSPFPLPRMKRLYIAVLYAAHATTSIVSFAAAFRSKDLRRRPSSPPLGASHKRQHVTYKNLEAMIDSFDQELVLLSFTSGNCGPCKIQKQELESLAKLAQLRSFKMFRIEMSQFPKLGQKFNISKLPCTIFVKGKEVVLRADGLIMAEELWDRLQTLHPSMWHDHPTSDD